MKRPYLNEEERQAIRLDTIKGAGLKMHLACMHYRKACGKGFSGWVKYRRGIKSVVKSLTIVWVDDQKNT